MNNAAVFGLGSMGGGMARSLLRAGFRTWGFDVVEAAVAAFVEAGGEAGDTATIAPRLDVVVLALLNAEQVESVLFGADGVAGHLRPGAVIIASATVAPDFTRDLCGRCSDMGLLYLDAPMSGGSVKAAAGELSFMASGHEDAFAAAGTALEAMAERVFNLGADAGAGSAMKAVNQLLAGIHIASMGEAMVFGIGQGIPAERILEVISHSAGNSWMFANRAPHVVDGDYTPRSAVNIWLKDLAIVREIAAAAGLDTPLTDSALEQFTEAAAAGLGAEDDAAVARLYARRAGVSLPGDH